MYFLEWRAHYSLDSWFGTASAHSAEAAMKSSCPFLRLGEDVAEASGAAGAAGATGVGAGARAEVVSGVAPEEAGTGAGAL